MGLHIILAALGGIHERNFSHAVDVPMGLDGCSKKLLDGIPASQSPTERRVVKELFDCCDR